ncbi:putative mediator of RNA polymerase II transcription subunit 24 [Monomorium pharaonis]|uniref:putative mediator of RNA polymerase II transcription subunit 24 n=1 Tax=Monomorium pharaonis TaxID=307658 RepID=UPI0017473988|nr:putative mediator of RNA polymerase II transcription subunit 24 [Monomorium pharaonis]
MQQEFYTSCIKINGIPLLPPLMTNTIKEEMRHYRSLAIKVEENLRDRRLLRHIIWNKCVQADVTGPVDKLRSIRYSSDSDVSSRDVASDTNNSDSYSRMTMVEPTSRVAGEPMDNHDIQSFISDVHTTDSQLEVCVTNEFTVNDSKPIAAATDQDKYIDAIEAVSTPNENVTLPENWKPEIPKTLDIVPISLSNDEEDISSSIGISKETKNPPKLSRQGSYVLETPSPVLLAHMHAELTDENYTPTPTTDYKSQRKQWSIAQSKVEWENKRFIAEDTEALSKLRSTEKRSTFEDGEPEVSTEPYQENKPISGTNTIVEEAGYRLDATPTKHNRRPSTDFKKHNPIEKLEKDTGVLNLLNREYTEDANSPKSQLSRINEKHHGKEEDPARRTESRKSNGKTKSSTPDKLLMIYKEIEEMHKKQMTELIYRQRKEQSLLQAEFQKQQMLLLAEIRKCASGTPRQANSSNVALNRSLSNNETGSASRESNVNSPGNIYAETHRNIKLSPLSNRVIVCPLDYLPSRNLYLLKHPLTADNSPATLDYDFTKKVSLSENTYNNNNNNNYYNNNNDSNNGNNDDNSSCESRDLIACKNSNVSRQLFPLDSNTTHVPVLDNTAYLEKHVQAVNIINAYARGYLVRRLMHTERVITLKRTYKEALQCMLKLHVDAPLNLAEVDFLHRLQLQCDAASMNIVELFAQSPAKRMKVIAQDREIKESRTERPTSARSYSFATQKTLARKNFKEFESTMAKYQRPLVVKRNLIRSRCQSWTSDMRDRLMSPNAMHQGIRRSTSTGAVRKPWR